METDKKAYFAIYYSADGDDEILGLYCGKYNTYYEHLIDLISLMKFRRNGKVIMIGRIWPKQISKAEYETYLEFKMFEEIKIGHTYDMDSGIKVIIPPIKFVDK